MTPVESQNLTAGREEMEIAQGFLLLGTKWEAAALQEGEKKPPYGSGCAPGNQDLDGLLLLPGTSGAKVGQGGKPMGSGSF